MMDILLRSEVVVKKKIISQVNLTNMPLFRNPINVRSAFKNVEETNFEEAKKKWLESGESQADWDSMTIEEKNNVKDCL
jgi:hypothetical protein